MALVIEDGSGVPGATSFVTTEELQAYAEQRGVELTEQEAETLSFEAMDFLTVQCFGGEQLFDLPFPRIGLVLPNGDELDFASIPAGVKKAQAQLVVDAKRGVKLVSSSNPEPMLKREKTGPLESEWFAPGDSGVDVLKPNVPIAMAALQPFLCGSQPFALRTLRV